MLLVAVFHTLSERHFWICCSFLTSNLIGWNKIWCHVCLAAALSHFHGNMAIQCRFWPLGEHVDTLCRTEHKWVIVFCMHTCMCARAHTCKYGHTRKYVHIRLHVCVLTNMQAHSHINFYNAEGKQLVYSFKFFFKLATVKKKHPKTKWYY